MGNGQEVNNTMPDNFCKQLIDIGFFIDSFYEDKYCFNNIIIETRVAHNKVTIVRDRGIWECRILVQKEEIPLVAVLNLLEGFTFDFEELTFSTEKQLYLWLVEHNAKIRSLSQHQLLTAKKQWNSIIKNRIKKT